MPLIVKGLMMGEKLRESIWYPMSTGVARMGSEREHCAPELNSCNQMG